MENNTAKIVNCPDQFVSSKKKQSKKWQEDTLKYFIINDLNKNYSFWDKKGTENPYFGAFREENQLLWFNRTQDRPGKQNNLKKLKKFFQDYPKYNAIVEDYLKPDYDFIKTLTFYKGPQHE